MFKPVEANPDFVAMEKRLLEHWEKNKIVDQYLHKNKNSKKTFSFQDGPITANNPMGVHHAWGRTYKDIWQKFYNLLGCGQRFRNGFDCQGLWVEVEVEKELGLKTKKDIENLVLGDKHASIAKFVALCKERVNKFSNIQTEQSKRLGYLMDWDNSYFTMADENNYMIWQFLKKCHENGWIYKGNSSVPWCPRCETAISQHEMLTEDYRELIHESVYLKLKIQNPKFQSNPKSKIPNSKFYIPNSYLLVWTTTPWTIPANIAVAVDKNIDYALVERENKENIWLAKDAIERVFKKDKVNIIKTIKGDKLAGLKYEGPFDQIEAVKKVAQNNPGTFHTVIITDERILPIITTEGTGLVHTAVSAGVEDFQLGQKYRLPMIPVIADNADYLPGLDWLSGKNAKKHPEIIIDFLKTHANGEYLLYTERYKHRYPACWRCKTELVWKVADEWYIAMDKPTKIRYSKFEIRNKSQIRNPKLQNNLTLRERMVAVAKKIKWMPEFGLERELDWLKNMHDWLISKKNRYWGLALPIYECISCGGFEVLGSKEELEKRAVKGIEKMKNQSPHKPFIDDVEIKCEKCGKLMKRIPDVGNPWLDAGIVEYSTISENNKSEPLYLSDKEQWRQWFPADFITESFPGQFKNWFYAQIAMSTVMENEPPFKQVLGFATMLGEDGRPMHKSWGNYIDFHEGAEKIGVDVMRWIFARQNPADNLLFGYKKTDEVRRQFYLILWNIYKFFVEYATLDKFKDQSSKIKNKDQKSKIKKNILDEWILNRFNWLVNESEKYYRSYNVKDVALEVERFVSDLSTWYIRRSRDRVWVNSDDKDDQNNFYSTLKNVLENLVIITSPIMPFLTDEIYINLTGEKSVHLSDWPKNAQKYNINLDKNMTNVRKICEIGRRIRKEKEIKMRQPLSEAIITLTSDKLFSIYSNIEEYYNLIRQELNVKSIKFVKGKSILIDFDTKITPDLINEGRLRDLVRAIQEQRKLLGVKLEDKVDITVPVGVVFDKAWLSKRVLARKITRGDKLIVEK